MCVCVVHHTSKKQTRKPGEAAATTKIAHTCSCRSTDFAMASSKVRSITHCKPDQTASPQDFVKGLCSSPYRESVDDSSSPTNDA